MYVVLVIEFGFGFVVVCIMLSLSYFGIEWILCTCHSFEIQNNLKMLIWGQTCVQVSAYHKHHILKCMSSFQLFSFTYGANVNGTNPFFPFYIFNTLPQFERKYFVVVVVSLCVFLVLFVFYVGYRFSQFHFIIRTYWLGIQAHSSIKCYLKSAQ